MLLISSSRGVITRVISASTSDLISSNLRPFKVLTAFSFVNSIASFDAVLVSFYNIFYKRSVGNLWGIKGGNLSIHIRTIANIYEH